MSTLKICRICLRTEAKGYKYERYQLKYFYEEVTALKVAEKDELPQWFCYECSAMLHKFHKFKEKCYMGQKCLKKLLWKGPITYKAVYNLDQALKLQSTLQKVTTTDKVKTFIIRDIELESNNAQKQEIRSYKHSETDNVANNRNKNAFGDGKKFDDCDLDTEYDNTINVQHINDIQVNIETGSNLNTINDNDSNAKNINDLNINDLNTKKVIILQKNNVNSLDIGCEFNTDDINDLNIRNSNDLDRDVVKYFDKDDINQLGTKIFSNTKSNNKNINTSFVVEDASNDELSLGSSTHDPFSPISILVQEDKVVSLKSEELKTKKSNSIELTSIKELGKCLSEEYWKKVILTEEEALKEFREKAEDSKYLDAPYKCTDCFKGFSKKDMLNRHLQSRHSEELGAFECRFCRMRFKWRCHLRKHIQQHYTKYECLRCHVVFHLDTSAALHEEYHSGVTRRCLHCGEQFRHVTTLYTHMRTHRSSHVCVRCGASFVSGAGLRQHARMKHHEDQSESYSSEGEEARASYCARCDIRFESRRAHTEHLFHSDMHTEGKEESDATPAKKIMGKRLREKITRDLRKRQCDSDTLEPIKVKRRKRVKRKHRKPSTCYQCGEQFSTQAACMKHHVAAHPRTSFHSPLDRHICELCGASLAPGSVAVHQNMHSRARVHTCDACARQFHSAVGLKRHLVTHTGEKPFACPLCEKRFTQSNSMKLHYRTFHLKQPYPKRIRKKKKDQPNQSTGPDTYGEESDSVPEMAPEVAAMVPPAPEVAPVLHAVGGSAGIEEDNMHYLTLS